LARSLIELSGLEPGKDIDIRITGTRPGEKLYEELLTAEEGLTATTHKRIFVAKRGNILPELIEEKIIGRIINGALPQHERDALLMIRELLPEFKEKEARAAAPKAPVQRTKGHAPLEDTEDKGTAGQWAGMEKAGEKLVAGAETS